MNGFTQAWVDGEWTGKRSIIDEGETVYRVTAGHAESEVTEWSE